MTTLTLADRLLAADPRAIARAISLIEDEDPAGAALAARIHPHTGRGYLIGVTGPPGAGKSTLVDRLIAEFRTAGRTVGVLAVDPTSPYSGGAILGDRVRMQAHAEDPGVFIRSMATRGHLGGLARTTAEAATVLDAAGFDIVIIETVGVGQDEIDIVRTADVSVVVLVPGSGDDVQALKAGIMEIADLFVINKADREGADRMSSSVESTLSLETWPPGKWRPPVLRAIATTGEGVPAIVEAIARFRAQAGEAQIGRRRSRAEWRLREMLGRRFMQQVETQVLEPGGFDRLLDRIAARELDAYTAAEHVLARFTRAAANGPGAPVAGATHEHPSPAIPATPYAHLDHVGIAVGDSAPLLALLVEALHLEAEPPLDVPSQKVRVRFVETGEAKVELVEPIGNDSPVGKFLSTRGPGLHHIALRVADLGAELRRLEAAGVRLIDRQPRAGAHGRLIAFVHPASAGGVLVELVQIADGDQAS